MILVGHDDSAASHAALEAAIAEARLRDVPLHVVRFVSHEGGESPIQAQREAEASERIASEMDALGATLVGQGLQVTTQLVHGLRGGAGRALLDEADQVGATLIVLGNDAHGQLTSIVLGSVLREVLMQAPCPVMAIRVGSSA